MLPRQTLLLALLLAGCAVYHPKPLSSLTTAGALESRSLNDSGLKSFVEDNLRRRTSWPPKSWNLATLTLVSFYYHPDLEVARAQYNTARAGIITAGARPNPTVSFAPQYDFDALAGVSPWTLALTFDIPIETAGKRGHRVAQASHSADSARLNIAATAWKVRSRLRANLLEFYRANQTQVPLREQADAQQQVVELLEKRLAVGEISGAELSLIRAAQQNALLSLRDIEQQTVEARAQAAAALGVPARAIQGMELPGFEVQSLPSKVASGTLRERALHTRADVLAALADYASRQSALQLEIAKQYPDVHLGPGYSWDAGADKWQLGISITLPVLNQNQGPIAEAEARRAEAAARFTQLQAQIIGDLDRTLGGYLAARRKLETAEALLGTQKRVTASAKSQLDAGQTDRPTYLSELVNLHAVERSYIEALAGAHRALGALEDAVQRPLNVRPIK